MRKTTFIAAALAGLLATSSASAQIVHDPRSLAQQLVQWRAQLEEMRKQYGQAQELIGQGNALYDSFNKLGQIDGIGDLLNQPGVRQMLPEDAMALGRAIDGDFDQLGSIGTRASAIREENRLYRPAETEGFTKDSYEALDRNANLAARDLAVGEHVEMTAAQRLQGIEELRKAISTAPNARAVMDLQARISAENALLQNDMLRMQGQQMRAAAEREIEVQRSRERQLARYDALARSYNPNR